MPTLTPNLSLQKPIVGGDQDVWGGFINGSFDTLDTLAIMPIATFSGNSTMVLPKQALQVVLATAGAGGITLILPSAIGATGKAFVFKKVDAAAGTVTIVPNNLTQTIDGFVTYALSNQYQFVQIVSNGNQWFITSSN